jgi:DNA-binding response OmpR family regulator
MRGKILLVDDSSTALLLAETVFNTHTHYDVVTARDGEEGVRKALAEKPNLILLDLVMPKMDGFATCQAIRAQDSLRHVPIVMVTTRGELADMERAYRCGCNAYVTKPINANELLAMARMFIGPDGPFRAGSSGDGAGEKNL